MKENLQPEEIESLLREGILKKETKQFGEAINLFTDAIKKAEVIGYSHGILHGLLNIGTIWNLQARETGSKTFARLAKFTFLEAQEYSTNNNLPLEESIHAKFLLGQAEYELGNFSKAVSLYQEAYNFYREHPRSNAHLGDVQRHLGTAMVKEGNSEEGIELIKNGLDAIRTFDEKDSFDKQNYVWETGALLALTDIYSKTDKKRALIIGNEALDIAKRENITIRKEEASKILEELKS